MKKNTHLQNAKDKKDNEFNKTVATRGKGEVLYLFERDKENKLIEPYSVKAYFQRVLLNYDSSKIKFLTKK